MLWNSAETVIAFKAVHTNRSVDLCMTGRPKLNLSAHPISTRHAGRIDTFYLQNSLGAYP